MKLLKTTFFSGVITIIRIGSGFVASKAMAVFAGPGGVAIIGAFANFLSIVLSLANGSITNGVVKYTAEYNNDEKKVQIIISTSLKISVVCSGFIGMLLILLSKQITDLLFNDAIYVNPIRLLGATVLLYSLNTLLISILNGRGQIRLYTIINTIGSIVSLLFTVVLLYLFGIVGALYSLVLSQSIVFFITFILFIRSPWFSWNHFKQPFSKIEAIKLSKFSLMAIVSALTVPTSQMILRNMIIKNLSLESAGLWQGMMRISDGYLLLLTTALSTYYLPKLSSLKLDSDLRLEVLKGYKLILPVVLIGCVIIYILRLWIINTLYTPSFLKMESLFILQLIGDFLKMASWVLGYLMLAKAMTKYFIFFECLFSITYICLGYALVQKFGLVGISMAFAINYLLYLFAMIYVFRRLLFNLNSI